MPICVKDADKCVYWVAKDVIRKKNMFGDICPGWFASCGFYEIVDEF